MSGANQTKAMKRPNLFNYATKELSQDAFFAWLARWADASFASMDAELNKLAQTFVRFLLAKQCGNFSEKITTVKTGRKGFLTNVDAWAIVNGKHLIVIEDKTDTGQHDNQLARYKAEAEKKGKSFEQIVFLYIKTGNECQKEIRKIEKAGYAYVSRQDLLSLYASAGQTGSDIVSDYFDHLQNIEDETQSFKTKPIGEWGWYEWQGFYMYLETRLDINDWHYTANPSGGFLGTNWGWTKWNDVRVYLQIEQGRLCFKAELDKKAAGNTERIRRTQQAVTQEATAERLDEVVRPPRIHLGSYVTFAIVERDRWLGKSGEVADLDAVVERLRKYESIISKLNGLINN